MNSEELSLNTQERAFLDAIRELGQCSAADAESHYEEARKGLPKPHKETGLEVMRSLESKGLVRCFPRRTKRGGVLYYVWEEAKP